MRVTLQLWSKMNRYSLVYIGFAVLMHGQETHSAKVLVNRVTQPDGQTVYQYSVQNLSGSPITKLVIGRSVDGDPQLTTAPVNWDFNTNLNPGSVMTPGGWNVQLETQDDDPLFNVSWKASVISSQILSNQMAAGFAIVLPVADQHFRTVNWYITRADATTDTGFLEATQLVVLGDVNDDGRADCSDIAIVKGAFAKMNGDIGFDQRADVNGDGVVDIRDLAFVSQHLPAGTRCP